MRSFLLLGLLGRLIAGQAAGNSLVDCGQVCELDAFGRRLTFPGRVVTKTVIATTASVVTYKDEVGSIIVQTTTKLADLPPVTWEVSGVTLTYPTTYVIYTDFVHSFVATQTAGGALSCSTGSADVDLGASTDFSSLIFPASDVTSTLPPTALVGYLESIPTVLAQLGGNVNSSCDPTEAASSSASGPQVVLTTINSLTTATTVFTTTTVTGQFQTQSGSELTVPITPPFPNGTTTRTSTVVSTSTGTLTTPSSAPATTTSASASSASSSPSTQTLSSTLNVTVQSSVTATLTSTTLTSPSGASLTTVTFTGALSSLESSPPGNVSATGTPTSSIQLANEGNQLGKAYVGTGGFLASILGLAIYWL